MWDRETGSLVAAHVVHKSCGMLLEMQTADEVRDLAQDLLAAVGGGAPSEARAEAVRTVLATLRSPLAMVSPERLVAEDLTRQYKITALDLFEAARTKARSA
jgi:hypothetical protein